MQPLAESAGTAPAKQLRWNEIFAGAWIVLALVSLLPLTVRLGASLPVFTVVWLGLPLIALIRTRSAAAVGMRFTDWRLFAKYGALNAGLLMLTMALVEPWSHTYRSLLQAALAGSKPDLTFVWLVRSSGAAGLASMFVFSALVTLFGEELFFRGWLLQALLKRMKPVWAIALQALLFTMPQALAALFLAPLQGVLYVFVYSWFGIGVLGGWAAWRTGSIWPSLAAAALMNLVLCLLVL